MAQQAGNPMGALVSDGNGGFQINLDLYHDNDSGTAGRNYLYQGYFNLDIGTASGNLSSADLTYDPAVPVPEPASYGLLAGAGLLVLGLRRQFTSARNA